MQLNIVEKSVAGTAYIYENAGQFMISMMFVALARSGREVCFYWPIATDTHKANVVGEYVEPVARPDSLHP